MKTLFIVISFLQAIIVFGQKQDQSIEHSEAIRKDNHIIVHSSDSIAKVYKMVLLSARDAGMSIKTKDESLYSFTFESPIESMGSGQMIVTGYVKEGTPNKVILHGSYTIEAYVMGAQSFGYTIEKGNGMKGTPVLTTWAKLEQIAQGISGGIIYYQRRK